MTTVRIAASYANSSARIISRLSKMRRGSFKSFPGACNTRNVAASLVLLIETRCIFFSKASEKFRATKQARVWRNVAISRGALEIYTYAVQDRDEGRAIFQKSFVSAGYCEGSYRRPVSWPAHSPGAELYLRITHRNLQHGVATVNFYIQLWRSCGNN